MQTKGTIIEVLPVKTGTSADGKEWKKITFVIETKEKYNNTLALDVFGTDKVDNFQKYNKVGDFVDVEFNVSTYISKNKTTGGNNYFTNASAWKIMKAKVDVEDVREAINDLPF